jgi:hypothetical protein
VTRGVTLGVAVVVDGDSRSRRARLFDGDSLAYLGLADNVGDPEGREACQ